MFYNAQPNLSTITVRSIDNPLSLLQSKSTFPSFTTHVGITVHDPTHYHNTINDFLTNVVATSVNAVADIGHSIINAIPEDPLNTEEEIKTNEEIDLSPNLEEEMHAPVQEAINSLSHGIQAVKDVGMAAASTVIEKAKNIASSLISPEDVPDPNSIEDVPEIEEIKAKEEVKDVPMVEKEEEKYEMIKPPEKNKLPEEDLSYMKLTDRSVRRVEDVLQNKEKSYYPKEMNEEDQLIGNINIFKREFDKILSNYSPHNYDYSNMENTLKGLNSKAYVQMKLNNLSSLLKE